MPLFDYAGFDASGKKVSGSAEGAGRRAVLAKLREEGIYASEVQETTGESKGLLGGFARQKVAVDELAMATRQIAVLLSAGLTLDETLATVGGQVENRHFGRALALAREAVIQGEALHVALSRHPRIFSDLYVNMIQVGESSGTLELTLERLADFLEEQAKLRGRILAAITYPLLMAVVGGSVLVFLVAFVVPKITRMIEDLGQALPLPTRLLIGVSHFLSSYGWILLILLTIAFFLLARYLRTTEGQLRRDTIALKLPLFGRLNTQIASARLTRTLATLLQSGMPMLKALEIARQLVGNRVLQRALAETSMAVREGEGLAEPLRRSRLLPAMVTQMIAVGEKSGELETMLLRVADTYEQQVDMAINRLLSLLEPLMILFMGSAVGFIVMAILLPIFEASSGMK